MLTYTKSEPAPRTPPSIELYRICVENRINIWRPLCGQVYREEWIDFLYALMGVLGENTDLFTPNCLLAAMDSFTYEYVYKAFGGMRKIGQFWLPPDDIADVIRLPPNRHPDGWIDGDPRCPLTWSREVGTGG